MASNQWYTRNAVEARKARKRMSSSFLPEFWLKDGESAKAVFLDREPVYMYQHQFYVRGKTKNYTCLRKKCPLCALKDPRYVAIYRVIDTRTFIGKDKKKRKNVEKYYVVGSRLQPTLERIEKNHQLFRRVVEITRTGTSTDTTYSALPIGKPKFELLPPKLDTLKDYAPKSREELEMIAGTLGMAVNEAEDYDDEDEDDDDESPKKNGKKGGKKRNYLKDEEDEDENEGEDEDEDEDADDDEDEEDGDDENEEDDDEEDDDEDEEDGDEEDAEGDDDDEDEDDDDEPVVRKKKKTKPTKKKKTFQRK